MSRQLTVLSIGYPGIDIEGIVALCQALSKGCLQALDLSHSELQDEGVILLAQALATDTQLTSLNLSGNPIHAPGALALAEMLQTNLSLCHLHWDSQVLRTHFPEASLSVRSVKQALQRNRRLQEVRGFLAQMDDLSLAEITGGLQEVFAWLEAAALPEPLLTQLWEEARCKQGLKLIANNELAEGMNCLAEVAYPGSSVWHTALEALAQVYYQSAQIPDMPAAERRERLITALAYLFPTTQHALAYQWFKELLHLQKPQDPQQQFLQCRVLISERQEALGVRRATDNTPDLNQKVSVYIQKQHKTEPSQQADANVPSGPKPPQRH